MPADKPTELSRIRLKTWTQLPVPEISQHAAHSTPLPFGFRTWLWRCTCLLFLISMLWHRHAIFKSNGDKLSFTTLYMYIYICMITYMPVKSSNSRRRLFALFISIQYGLTVIWDSRDQDGLVYISTQTSVLIAHIDIPRTVRKMATCLQTTFPKQCFWFAFRSISSVGPICDMSHWLR